MKITAARGVRRAEVAQRKAEYDEQQRIHDEAYRDASARSRDARAEALKPVQDALMEALSQFTALHFDIDCRIDYSWNGDDVGRNYINVRVQCDQNNPTPDTSLRWEYSAHLSSSGSVVAETGSWSGLKATTPAQLRSLRQTVSALELLNTLDWKQLLDREVPDTDAFFADIPKAPERVDWTSQFNVADLEDLVGDKSSAVLVNNWENSGYWGRSVYVRILRDAGSQFVVNIIPTSEVDRYKQGGVENFRKYTLEDTKRVKKTTIRPIRDHEGNAQYWDIPEELAAVGG